MSYIYEVERHELFTERGQVAFIKVRDRVQYLLKTAGAFRMDKIESLSWQSMACVDRMVELGELVEVSRPGAWGQHRVFTDPRYL